MLYEVIPDPLAGTRPAERPVEAHEMIDAEAVVERRHPARALSGRTLAVELTGLAITLYCSARDERFRNNFV